MKTIMAAQKAKPLIIHIKPFMQDVGFKPTYGITKVAILDGELTYIAEKDNGDPLYIFSRWVEEAK